MCDHADDVVQESGNFYMPTEFCPGLDLISKIILTDEQIVNKLAATLLKAPKGSYEIEPLDSGYKHISTVLYVPRNPSSNFPPIVINTINAFDDLTFSRIIRKCTNVFESYKKSPVCLIIVAQELDENNIDLSSVHQEFPFFREIPCVLWARQCLLVSSTDSRINKATLNNNPLLEIVIALTEYDKVVLCHNDFNV